VGAKEIHTVVSGAVVRMRRRQPEEYKTAAEVPRSYRLQNHPFRTKYEVGAYLKKWSFDGASDVRHIWLEWGAVMHPWLCVHRRFLRSTKPWRRLFGLPQRHVRRRIVENSCGSSGLPIVMIRGGI